MLDFLELIVWNMISSQLKLSPEDSKKCIKDVYSRLLKDENIEESLSFEVGKCLKFYIECKEYIPNL